MTQIDFRKELTANRQQLSYMYNLLQNQNEFGELAFDEKISKYLTFDQSDDTPFSIAVHGIEDLYKLLKTLENDDLHLNDVEFSLDSFLGGNASELLISLYDYVLREGDRILGYVKTPLLQGEWKDIAFSSELVSDRISFYAMHAIHHIGQSLMFQHLISESMHNRGSTVISMDDQ